MINMKTLYNSITAELLKLKYAPIIWLCFSVVLIITAIISAAATLDQASMVQLGKNPWPRHLGACLGILSVFMVVPFTVMLVSTSVFIENHSKGWKYIYSTPRRRSLVFYSKLMAILKIIVWVILSLIVVNVLSGFIIDLFIPEIEFKYYEVGVLSILPSYFHLMMALLGIIGIQYFLSLRFKGFLVPMSIGIIAYIVAFIIGTLNKPMALYYPYCYPSIYKDHSMFSIDKIGVTNEHFLSNVEIHSIFVFLFFIGLAHVLEIRKNVS